MHSASTVTQKSAFSSVTQINNWTLLGLSMLGVRLVQGWVYWAGASRRLIYSEGKLDPSSSEYMAYEMNKTIPGAIFGSGDALSYLMHSPSLLHMAIIVFTLIELFVGVGLILGLFTRFFGLISVCLAISLMLMYGWLGSTCVDEWTMAANSFAMGLGIMTTGSGRWWSMDYWLLNKYQKCSEWSIFPWLFSGPLPIITITRFAKIGGVMTILFAAGFYGYLRGAVFSPMMAKTNPKNHHIALTHSELSRSGDLIFSAYVDAGPDTQGDYVVGVSIIDEQGQEIEVWDGKTLNELSKTNFENEYKYSTFETTQYGFVGVVGARAKIFLPHQKQIDLAPGTYQVILLSIDGKLWSTHSIIDG